MKKKKTPKVSLPGADAETVDQFDERLRAFLNLDPDTDVHSMMVALAKRGLLSQYFEQVLKIINKDPDAKV